MLRRNTRVKQLKTSGASIKMVGRHVFDDERHAQFVTFSCYKRRRLLDHPRAKEIVTDVLAQELAKHNGGCLGFVVMPDHVHAIVWFPTTGCLSDFMKVWKGRSSRELKLLLRGTLPEYARTIDSREPCWQPKYYAFNVYSESKAREKLEYMHLNPVRARLIDRAIDWPWSSARYYELGEPCPVPLAWEF